MALFVSELSCDELANAGINAQSKIKQNLAFISYYFPWLI
jgi:hypothetical protein